MAATEHLIPADFAIRNRCVEVNGSVWLDEENGDSYVLSEISALVGNRPVVRKAFHEIQQQLQSVYDLSDREFAAAQAQFQPFERSTAIYAGSQIVDDSNVIEQVHEWISEAIYIGASDIHIEVYEEIARVRFRLDGVLFEQDAIPLSRYPAIISRIKIMSDLDIGEKRRPQDGRIQVTNGSRTVDIRVSMLPTEFGEKAVMRLLDKSAMELSLSNVGFDAAQLSIFRRAIQSPYGMILVTGPTGSGKTTTLYSALNERNDPDVNILTVEDPIEYNLPGVNQSMVKADIGYSFASALRSFLRQDPDIIMVGEIRDSETADIAIRAALTGHLVFSTLHTNDSPSTISRLLDMDIEPFLIATSVRLVMAQRLVRRICEHCKEEQVITEDIRCELERLAIEEAITLYHGVGCKHCLNTGYRGRTAVFELLPVDAAMQDAITQSASTQQLRTLANQAGMTSLTEAGIAKVRTGETTLAEVLRELYTG